MEQTRKRFLTIEEAGIILGGDRRPLSPSTIRRLIAAQRIKTTADARKLRRIIGSSVYELADKLEQGGSLWHDESGRRKANTAQGASMKARKAQAGGSHKSQTATATTSVDEPWTPLVRK